MEYHRNRISGIIDSLAKLAHQYNFADITSGKTITASSFYSGYPASNAIDNNNSTRWTQVDGTMPQWLKVDFSKNVFIYQYSLYSFAESPSAWVLEGSIDDITWNILDFRTGQSVTTRTEYQIPLYLVGFYRYYKITFLLPGTWISVYELEMSES